RIALYALGLTPSVAVPFEALARFTGGEFYPSIAGDAAVVKLKEILAAEFGNLDLDRRVLAAWEAAGADAFSIDETAATLSVTPGAVAAAVTRLGARRLLLRDTTAQRRN